MQSCSADDDCRNGYECVEVAAGNGWSATIVDDRVTTRICALAVPPPSSGPTEYCEATPGDVPPSLPAAPVLVPPSLQPDAGADASAP